MPQQTVRTWLHSLIAAAIGGGANAITVVIVDPVNFNFTTGLGKVLSVAGVSALVSVALFLKQSPLPDTVTVQTVTETHSVKTEITKEAVAELSEKEAD